MASEKIIARCLEKFPLPSQALVIQAQGGGASPAPFADEAEAAINRNMVLINQFIGRSTFVDYAVVE